MKYTCSSYWQLDTPSPMIDLAPLLAVLIIDVFGLDKIWGERRTYRLINHLSKGLFDRRKTPWIVKLPGLISKEQREKLANLVLPDEQNMTTTSPRASSALNAMYSQTLHGTTR